MTNPTSVTVSTADATFLLLPAPFPELLQPGACWLLLSGPDSARLLAATSLQSHLTSSGRSPGLVLLQEGEAAWEASLPCAPFSLK